MIELNSLGVLKDRQQEGSKEAELKHDHCSKEIIVGLRRGTKGCPF